MEFGERLKQAREKKGMTQQTLADRLFVTRQTVSRWENGVRYPDILTVRKLSEILEISLDDLLSQENPKQIVERSPILENRTADGSRLQFICWQQFLICSGFWGFCGNRGSVRGIHRRPQRFSGNFR